MFENVNSSLLRDYAPDLDYLRLQDWLKDNQTKQRPKLTKEQLRTKRLENKLKGITDNSERYSIIDKYLTDQESISKNVEFHGNSFKESGSNFVDTKGMSLSQIKDIRDKENTNSKISNSFMDETLSNKYNYNKPNTRTQGRRGSFVNLSGIGFKSNSISNDAISNSYNSRTFKNIKKDVAKHNVFENLKSYLKSSLEKPSKYLNNRIIEAATSMPNPIKDAAAAGFHGVHLEETKSSLFDRYAKRLTNLTNKDIDPAIAAEVENSLTSYKGINRISGESMNINYLGDMSEKEIEQWKQMQREETSKFVRKKGGNIDPFDSKIQTPEGYLDNLYTSKSVLEASNLQHTTNKNNLADVRERLKQASNQYSQFFNNADKTELEDLKVMEQELERRIDLHEKGYNWNHIYGNEYTPDSKFSNTLSDSDRLLIEKRENLNTKINELSKVDSKNNWASINNLKNQLDDVDKQIQGNYKNRSSGISTTATASHPDYIKESHAPTYGTSGFGLGFKNSMAASGGEHLARFGHYMNPFGSGGASFSQALMESAGIMNKSQRMQAAQARGFSKLMSYAVPATALGFIVSDMHEGKEGMEILGEVASMGTALHGWRVGTSLGGAIGSLGGRAGKFIGLGVGGIAGAASGLLLGEAVIGGISDAMSQDSEIRKFSKKMSSKEMFVSTPDSRQSLTARSAALQKLAKSGLNDRGLLLGNEATILKG